MRTRITETIIGPILKQVRLFTKYKKFSLNNISTRQKLSAVHNLSF